MPCESSAIAGIKTKLTIINKRNRKTIPVTAGFSVDSCVVAAGTFAGVAACAGADTEAGAGVEAGGSW